MVFSVISNWIYSPFNNLTFAQPYLERTFTWKSSVAQLSLACFQCKIDRIFLGKQARLSWATLEFQVKVRSKYGCANVRLLKGL